MIYLIDPKDIKTSSWCIFLCSKNCPLDNPSPLYGVPDA